MNQDYRAIYKSTGTVPRTMGEAFKTAEYATAIQRHKSDTREAFEFLFEMLLGLAYVVVPVLAIYLALTWLK